MNKVIYSKLLIFFLFVTASFQLNAACNWSNVNTNWSYQVSGGKITVGLNMSNYPCIKQFWSLAGGTYVPGSYTTFTVSKNGGYKICMKLYDTCKKCDTVVCKEIKVDGITTCSVDFTASINRDEVKFKPSFACNGKASYLWKLGNGTFSTNFDPTVKYKKGTYEVCLTATCITYNQTTQKYDTCVAKTCKKIVIKEEPCNLQGDFTYKIGDKGEVLFIGTSNQKDVIYYWNIDNDARKGRDFRMTLKPGVHKVCLTIYNQKTNCKVVICKTITIPEPKPECKVDFIATITKDGVKYKPVFQCNGTASYYWILGNGNTSGNVDPFVKYKKGTYEVCLYAKCVFYNKDKQAYDSCLAKTCKKVVVKDNPCELKGDFTFKVGPNYNVILAGTGSNQNLLYYWTINNDVKKGQYLSLTLKPGTYQICLTIYDQKTNCSITICKSITIKENSTKCNLPKGWGMGNVCLAYTFEGFNPVDANNNTYVNPCLKYAWDFGDKTTATGRLAKHQYAQNGTYTLCMKVIDTCNKCDTMICKTITVNCTDNKCILPKTWNSSNKTCSTYTFEGSLSIVNNSYYLNPCHKYYWSFGDNTYATGRVAQHTFSKSGTYTVCMKVIDTCKKCDTMICKTVTVSCCNPYMQAEFSDTLQLGGTVKFVNQSANGVYYKWLFGDNTTSADKNISHTYTNAGGYTVCLIVYDSTKNCTDTFCKYIQVSIKRGSASISSNATIADLQLYPNPTAEGVNVTGFEFNAGDVLHVRDMTGKIVRTIQVSASTSGIYIDMKDIVPGVYTIDCQTINGNLLNSRLIKQ